MMPSVAVPVTCRPAIRSEAATATHQRASASETMLLSHNNAMCEPRIRRALAMRCALREYYGGANRLPGNPNADQPRLCRVYCSFPLQGPHLQCKYHGPMQPHHTVFGSCETRRIDGL